MEYQIKLDVFQGPLDLLLHLIEKDEIDIYNIPIATITEKYLDYLNTLKQFNLGVVGDFLVMAATLMQIKVKMLLPRYDQISAEENGGDEEDPRWELVCKLVEYKRIKEAARSLVTLEKEQLKVYTRVAGEFPDKSYAIQDDSLKSLSVWDLVEAFKVILDSLEVKLLKSAIPKPELSIRDRMEYIDNLAASGKYVSFKSLFEDVASRLGVITCFLAVLELVRIHRIVVFQESLFGEIYFAQASQEQVIVNE